MSIRRGDTLIEVVCAIVVFALVSVIALTLMNMGVTSAQAALETTMTRNEIDAQAEAIRFLQSAYIAERGFPEERQQYADVWRKITDPYDQGGLSIDPSTLDTTNWLGRGTCSQLYDENHDGYIGNNYGFIINTRFIQPADLNLVLEDAEGAEISRDAFLEMMLVQSRLNPDNFQQAPLYPRIIYSDSVGTGDSESGELIEGGADNRLYRLVQFVEGIWVVVVRGGTVDEDGSPEYYDFHIRTCWNPVGRRVASTIGTIVRVYNPDRAPVVGGPSEPEPSDRDTGFPGYSGHAPLPIEKRNSNIFFHQDGIGNQYTGPAGVGSTGVVHGAIPYWDNIGYNNGNESSQAVLCNGACNNTNLTAPRWINSPPWNGVNGMGWRMTETGDATAFFAVNNTFVMNMTREYTVELAFTVSSNTTGTIMATHAPGAPAGISVNIANVGGTQQMQIKLGTTPRTLPNIAVPGGGTKRFVSMSIVYQNGSVRVYLFGDLVLHQPSGTAATLQSTYLALGATVASQGNYNNPQTISRDAVIHAVRMYGCALDREFYPSLPANSNTFPSPIPAGNLAIAQQPKPVRWNYALDAMRFNGDITYMYKFFEEIWRANGSVPPPSGSPQCRMGSN